jgi:hypothetical protein
MPLAKLKGVVLGLQLWMMRSCLTGGVRTRVGEVRVWM